MIANADQANLYSDGFGDMCDVTDMGDDNNGFDDDQGNCPSLPNADQTDSNMNGIGDDYQEDDLCLPIRTNNNETAVVCSYSLFERPVVRFCA